MTAAQHPFDHYIVQTLFDEKWRRIGLYDEEETAQGIARKLVPDWGKLRVRILGGYFSSDKNRNVYYKVDIREAPKFRHSRTYKTAKFVIGSAALGGVLLGLFVIGYSVITPISSMAADGKGPETALNERPTPIAPIAKPVNLRARFVEVINVPYGKVRDFDTVPLRLRGPWSTACNTDGGEVVINERDLSHSVEGDLRTPLTSVWQTGQRYGLVLKSGSVDMVDMISADRLQKIGTMNRNGEFIADTSGAILKRCL